jgi:transketolase
MMSCTPVNRLQQGARLSETNDLAPFTPKLAAFGWEVEEIDGHDMEQICRALSSETAPKGRPKCIVAHTNKGHGISFMSDNVAWHHKVPNEAQYRQAMAELEEAAR